ncbi:MAG: glycosyltransferase [Phycisphaerae bacterium]
MRILHLLDHTTPTDAFDLLALLLPHFPGSQLAALGHRNTRFLAAQATITAPITFLPSTGWADPTSLRPLHRLLADFQPTHLHAWGFPAIAAASLVPTRAHRIATLTTSPTRAQRRLLRIFTARTQWTLTTTSEYIARALRPIENRKSKIENLPRLLPQQSPTTTPSALRTLLELSPTDGPLLLLAGDGPSARHDFGLWAAAILSQLYPNARAILREDPRGAEDPGLTRFLNNLPDDRLITIAPPTATWPDLLSLADLMLLTPAPTLPTPTAPLLHALAANVPIIATPVPCITEIITDGTNGLLANSPTPRAIAARLEEFMTDPNLRQTISHGARTWTTTQPTPTQFLAALTNNYNDIPAHVPHS